MTLRPVIDKDRYFMLLALLAATRSKDPSSNIGAIIVSPSTEGDVVRSTGYNGFPAGVNDSISVRYERPIKYLWFEHAERNAIYACARSGTSTQGCRIYTNSIPCADCTRAIIQAGISHLFIALQWPTTFSQSVTADYNAKTHIANMLQEAGIGLNALDMSNEAEIINAMRLRVANQQFVITPSNTVVDTNPQS